MMGAYPACQLIWITQLGNRCTQGYS